MGQNVRDFVVFGFVPAINHTRRNAFDPLHDLDRAEARNRLPQEMDVITPLPEAWRLLPVVDKAADRQCFV